MILDVFDLPDLGKEPTKLDIVEYRFRGRVNESDPQRSLRHARICFNFARWRPAEEKAYLVLVLIANTRSFIGLRQGVVDIDL